MTTLLLIPGLAADARMWRGQIERLREWQPVVVDVARRHDSIEAMAAGLLKEHAGDLWLCGASMGGMIAMQACHQAPQRVKGLALLGTNARPETADMRQIREAAIALFEQGRLDEVIRPNIALAFHPDNAGNGSLTQAYLDFVLEAGAEQLIRQNRAIVGRPDARVHLPQVRCPTLVLCGEADRLTPPECSREIAAAVPGAVFHLLPGCGHMLTMEQPEAVNTALRQWLRGLATSAGPAR